MTRSVFIALTLLASCVQDRLIPEFNATPIADAKAISAQGESVDEKSDAAGLMFAYAGSPVAITLDGSASSDADGTVVQYLWLSGTRAPDAGMSAPSGRLVPPNEAADWPADERQPKVQLGEGVWVFSLWVVDNQGATSEPDTLRITVGSSADAAAACATQVLPSVAPACKRCLCEQNDACRQAANQSVCGEDCWGLVRCIRDKCPNFAMTMDTACVTANCSAFITNGRAGATPIGPCVTACSDACAVEP